MKQNLLKAFVTYLSYGLVPVIVLLLVWVGSLCSFNIRAVASNDAYLGFNLFWNCIAAIGSIIYYNDLSEKSNHKAKQEEEKKAEMARQLEELEFDRLLTEAVRRNVEGNLSGAPDMVERIVSKKGVVYQNIPNSKI